MTVDWIKIEPVRSAEIKEIGFCEGVFCKIKFRNCIDIILDDEEVAFLQNGLNDYLNGKALTKIGEISKTMEKLDCIR